MGDGAGATEGILKTFFVRSGQVALTVLVTWFIVDRTGLSVQALKGVDPASWVPRLVPLVASALLLAFGYFFSAALWGRIVVGLGGPRIPIPEAVRIFMIANLGRYIPGKVWQIAGLAALARKRGVSAATATAAAVLGQGLTLVAALFVGLGALLGGGPTYRAWGTIMAIVLLTAIAIGVTPPVFRRATGLWFRVAGQEPPPGLNGGRALRWLLLYGANWLVYAFSFWLMAVSFRASLPVVPVASAFAAAYALGYLAIFSVAGLGVREASMVVFLSPWMGAGPATVLSVLARIWTTIVELVPASAFWVRYMTVGTSGAHKENGRHPGMEGNGV
jgi:uncharacterized membrane protein YbhN (UPF0104 family)